MTPFRISPKTRQYLIDVATKLEVGETVRDWTRYKSTYRQMNAFHNAKLGLVLKNPAFILDDSTPMSVRVPTVEITDEWVAQPIVSKTRLKMAVDAINKVLVPYRKRGIAPDVHVGNAGWYNGKPVLFDW